VGQLATLLRDELGQAPGRADIFAGEGLTPAEAAVWPFVRDEAAAAGVEPALIMAIIGHESNFKIRAVNPYEPKGGPSTGLMQVQLPTARAALRNPQLQMEQLFDPLTNVRAGTRYLADQLRRYRDYGTALAAYNAGSPYRDAAGRFVNQAYVDDVLRRLPRYRAVLPAPAPGPGFGASLAQLTGGAGFWPLVGGAGVLLLGVGLRARRQRA
jgi:soluble lytic murein transglycosylase-like protein